MYNFDDLPDLLDPNDPEINEILDELQAEGMFKALEVPTTPDMSDQEKAITWFLWDHEQDLIVAAQEECLAYIWDDGKLH